MSATRPEGIDGSTLAGPFAVGDYAQRLRGKLREFARVQVHGELSNLSPGRARVYFELRDARGALPCSMWRDAWDRLGLDAATLAGGAQVVVGGGCDYYPGSSTASPSFSFDVTELRIAGEGDLLVQIEALRRRLAADGLLEPQRALARRTPPRAIGVVTGEGGKARSDVLAGLHRQGWAGRLVWAFAPVQDRRAAPRIAAALRDLAAYADVDAIVVARGGGSLTDLMCFSDETLCRTVAALPVPVICSVGHHTDRTLLDDVAAESCSTPTHAAAVAVGLDCAQARRELAAETRRLETHARRAVVERARHLSALSRAPADHLARHRRRLHQLVRELRASARRRASDERALARRRLLVLERKTAGAALTRARGSTSLALATTGLARSGAATTARERRDLERLALTLAAHDPARTLARGYALVEGGDGAPLTSAAAARAAGRGHVRFHDGAAGARFEP